MTKQEQALDLRIQAIGVRRGMKTTMHILTDALRFVVALIEDNKDMEAKAREYDQRASVIEEELLDEKNRKEFFRRCGAAG